MRVRISSVVVNHWAKQIGNVQDEMVMRVAPYSGNDHELRDAVRHLNDALISLNKVPTS